MTTFNINLYTITTKFAKLTSMYMFTWFFFIMFAFGLLQKCFYHVWGCFMWCGVHGVCSTLRSMMELHMGDGLWWICTLVMAYSVVAWHQLGTCLAFFLGCWGSPDSLGDVLHDGHKGMVACLENALLRRRRVFHLEGGHLALENIG